MAGIYGALGLAPDSHREFLNTIGQDVVYSAVQQVLAQHVEDQEAFKSIFVARSTEDFSWRYSLAGGGRQQKVARGGRPQAVKQSGYYDVAFPLEEWGDQLASDDISYAYMRLADLDRHMSNITQRDANTYIANILTALLTTANLTFVDEHKGSLTVRRLANADGTTYPPLIGVEAETTSHTHYIETNYAPTAISDTNDPYKTIVDHLEHHFGTPTGGSRIAIFQPADATPDTLALTKFTEVSDMNVTVGDDTDTVNAIPSQLMRGTWRVLGTIHNAWVCEWARLPATYMLGIHLDAEPPLIERVDPADTGLKRGLHLVSREREFPFDSAFYRHRYGLGVGNRLSAVALELGVGGSYTSPTI